MTNRERLIKALKGEVDDITVVEAIFSRNIDCPYIYGDVRSYCRDKEVTPKDCFECKNKWLDSDVNSPERILD